MILFKAGNREEVIDNRPISTLPLFFVNLEMGVTPQPTEHLESARL